MDRKRLAAAVGIAVLTGLAVSVLAVVGSIAVVVLRGASMRVPGLVDYVQTDRVVSMSTDHDLWVTVLVLSALSLPVSWYVAGRRHPRTSLPAQLPSGGATPVGGVLPAGGGGEPAGKAPDPDAGAERVERAAGSVAAADRPSRRSSSPANA